MNPWVLLGGIVAALVLSATSFFYGRSVEHTAMQLEITIRENNQIREANAKIMELQSLARAKERDWTTRLANVSSKYEKEIQDGKAQRDRDIAAALSGGIRLRIPTAPCVEAGRSSAPEAPSSPGKRDGGATTELPREITANLLALADDADSIVRQLTACQAVVIEDRK